MSARDFSVLDAIHGLQDLGFIIVSPAEQRAGYRILAPGALDAETLERAAEVAESHIAESGLSDNPAYVRFSSADAMSKKIAAAIRSLKLEGGGGGARVRAEANAEGGETLVDVVTEDVWQHDASQDNCLVIDTDGLADDPASQPSVKVKPLDEDDYEEIISAAAINMRKATSGTRGQVVTVQDSLDWWVMKETERRILSALTAGKPHPDDEAVDRFAAAMKAKLKWEREERGRHGWNDPSICPESYLARLLIEHLAKGNDGNFEDVANFCMMLHQRGAHPRVLADALTAGKPEQSGWQPIETAPKDGTQFQVWLEKYGWEPRARFNPNSGAFELWGRVDYDIDGWDVYPHMVPTHWMPLPTPPTAGGGDE